MAQKPVYVPRDIKYKEQLVSVTRHAQREKKRGGERVSKRALFHSNRCKRTNSRKNRAGIFCAVETTTR